MQVRKYEASTIKEAVEQIKQDLGPDAIILSTRETAKRLGGEIGSKVIITAAVNEETYNKKKFVEGNLTEAERIKLLQKPAKVQRQFIDEIYKNLSEKMERKRQKLSEINYASIEDDDGFEEEEVTETKPKKSFAQKISEKTKPKTAYAKGKAVAAAAAATKEQPSTAINERVLSAVKEAAQISYEKELDGRFSVPAEIGRIEDLKKEIHRLRGMLKNVSQSSIENKPEANHPGAKMGVSAETSKMFQYLVQMGIDESIAADLMKQARARLGQEASKKAKLDAWVAKWILSNVKVVQNPLESRFHFFVGPRGVGKTSTLVKMASHLAIKERQKVAIITTDTSKVGATEQLRIYSQILNIPFAVWRKGQKLNDFIKQLDGIDYILFDTPGCSLLNSAEIDDLQAILPKDLNGVAVHLVLSAVLKDEDLYSAARRFKFISYDDVIMTNLDQVHRHGFLVNLHRQAEVPYYAFSNGPMIPEDYEWASKEQVLDYIFKISKSTRAGGRHDR